MLPAFARDSPVGFPPDRGLSRAACGYYHCGGSVCGHDPGPYPSPGKAIRSNGSGNPSATSLLLRGFRRLGGIRPALLQDHLRYAAERLGILDGRVHPVEQHQQVEPL